MQTDEVAAATDNLSGEQRVRFLSVTFRHILLVVFLIFIFAAMQMLTLWQVCNAGMATAASLKNKGLPTLNELASLQEHLAIYRLDSYEYLFAQEAEKAGKAKAADDLALQIRAELKNIQALVPEGEGRQLAASLENAVDDLAAQFQKVRSLVNSDFPAAMKSMDQDIPPRTRRVDAAANALKQFGYQFSSGQAKATFASFGWIKTTAVLFGATNCVVAFCAIMFVLLAARRNRAQLSQTLARLDERTKELDESHLLYHSLVDQMPAGVFRKDAEGRFVFVNSWYCRIKGMEPNQILGKTPRELASGEFVKHPAAAKEIQSAIQGANHHELIMANGKQIGVEEFYSGDDGKIQHWHVVKSPVVGPEGKIIGTQGIFFDVTERDRADAALAQERNLLRTMIDNLPEAIYIKDLSGRKTLANPAELKNMGCKTEAEAVGRSDFEIYPRELAAGYFADDQAVIQSGQPLINREEKVITPTGELHWVLSSKIPLHDAAGNIIGLVGVGRDITIIKEAEAKLEQVHKQLLETSRQAGMAEIATNVLHNVGNVLNSVNVSASLVVDGMKKSKVSSLGKIAALLQEHEQDLGAFFTGDPRGRQVPAYLLELSEHFTAHQQMTLKELDLLRSNIEHIKEIVAMQQNYAKVSGIREPVDLHELVEDSLRMNEGTLSRHGVEVVREFEDVPKVEVEKHKVLQILVNLMRNAKHACQGLPGGNRRLTVRVTQNGGWIKISVMDNGIGIPAENLARIFNHGFTTKKDGHGFGLHSGALAAKEMGGSLTVHSDGPGLGATFTLELPGPQTRNQNA